MTRSRSIFPFAVLALLIAAAIAVNACGGASSDTPTPTGTPSPTGTEPPTATPTPTPLPEERKEQILRTYELIVLIRLDAEGTNEIAEGRVSGELAWDQVGRMWMGLTTNVGIVEELISDIDPPAELANAWQVALQVHESTKGVLRRWFNEEIDAAQVLVEMPDILRDAEKAVLDAEAAIEATWQIAAEELGAMRDEALRKFEWLFRPTPTP